MENNNEQQNISQPLQPEGNGKRKRQVSKARKIFDIVLSVVLTTLIITCSIALFVRCFIGSNIVIYGNSMMPNYENGQSVWVDKRATPQRGDIVVVYKNYVKNHLVAEFDYKNSQAGGKYEKLIKRVVAVAGDKIWIEQKEGGWVLVVESPDGRIFYEDYYTAFDGSPAMFYDAQKNLTPIAYLGYLGNLEFCSAEKPMIIRPGKFYVMGDNRSLSNDSRNGEIGTLESNRLYGVVKIK